MSHAQYLDAKLITREHPSCSGVFARWRLCNWEQQLPTVRSRIVYPTERQDRNTHYRCIYKVCCRARTAFQLTRKGGLQIDDCTPAN
jgi:hypothetical protein